MFGEEEASAQDPLIKICGITNAADAREAIEAGADALGFNCYTESKRFVELKSAREWIQRLPGQACRVAVVVNPSWEEALAISALPFIDALQLHGQETPEFCARLAAAKVRFGKALSASAPDLFEVGATYSTPIIILDSISGRHFGGTGTTFPWEVARNFALRHPGQRVIVAGGLTPENVAEAIKVARPFGVDVTGGVESTPGHKNHPRLRAFIDAARRALIS